MSIKPLLLLLFLVSMPLLAEPPLIVRHHTPAWSAITNADGSGLYHQVFKEVFAYSNVQVKAAYLPLLRALADVEQGKADMAGGIGLGDERFLYASQPIYQSRVSAFFHKKLVKNWQGMETIKQHEDQTVVSVGMGKLINIKGFEVNSRYQALNMLLRKRALYYVDATELFEGLYQGDYSKHFNSQQGSKYHAPFNPAQYTYRSISDVSAYMVFQKSERGEKIKALFESGFKTLFESGRLLEIYKQWGFERAIVKILLDADAGVTPVNALTLYR